MPSASDIQTRTKQRKFRTSQPPHSPVCHPLVGSSSSILLFPFWFFFFSASLSSSSTCGVNPSTTSNLASFSSLVANVYPNPGQNLLASTAYLIGLSLLTTASHRLNASEPNN